MSQLFRFYTYKLDPAAPQGPVTLSVTIGNGQMGSSMVQLNGKPLLAGQENSFSLDITDPATLSGKTIDLFTTITDVNPDNNDISFRLKLTEGQSVLNPATERFKVEDNGYFQIIIKIVLI
ncbi:MAG: hypothetical protein SFV22_04145 [Saprospiraceae bacterium]|nr:hypothetical protein [Saprospiraceae bacterium]